MLYLALYLSFALFAVCLGYIAGEYEINNKHYLTMLFAGFLLMASAATLGVLL